MQSLSGPVLTAEETRAAEAASGTDVHVLMERAGACLAEAVWRYGAGRPTLILCGPGNNGGDGYVAARLLAERGLAVQVAALRQPRASAAIQAASLWSGPVEVLDAAKPAPILVDAIFGPGLQRPLEPDVVAAIDRLTTAARFTIACDLPSGVDVDTGAALGANAFDMTVALAALKPAHLLHPAAKLCGHIELGDIGVAASSSLHVLARPALHAPDAKAHKYRRGFVGIVGGAMGGAGMLAARAAMPLAGYVALAGAKRTGPDALVHRRVDSLLQDDRIGALLVGPGLGRDEKATVLLNAVWATGKPLVVDADALILLDVERIAARKTPMILTPHEGEFSALFGEIGGSKVERARSAASRSGAVIVLKGADTVIAAPDGRAVIASTAPGWLASAGTGDVLAGTCSARLAANGDPFAAACEGVWLHGEAARRAGPALIADDLPRHIPAALAACL